MIHNATNTSSRALNFLDTFAVSMSLLCAVHCLITPILLIVLPILATSVWVHKDFHIWMMILVIPTTVIAMTQGCKKHKDKMVIILSSCGLATLLGVAIYESYVHGITETAHCSNCVSPAENSLLTMATLVNISGGILLASAHVRNFLLCRKSDCCHSE